ncbi:CAF1 family ribonuclease (macronuclear) [Tetrahymena thermophila SB210]|uniref:CAF1 family ribonuclease n=1 Tax=Tetrahymena thermophila (strain SB210) TaxID=312017 RepID=W7X035_TETTS|nr:CAF1 family ribonuclease [Tetrahymena thermophila SB210]EWS71222.1 CAF1 family ribonuclease [Tetrahymena thermophila SB210]|eukprot:XP_012656243.1 CAF1 family ribonuclease [Tetrahymena thermophila SB210]
MQVTKQNFEQSFQIFSDLVNSPKTEFISYDFEMTGIRTTEKESYNDMPFERYEKCAQVARKYALIQAGLTVFHKEDSKYTAYPFNAYVIRRKIENTSYKPEVVLESGAIKFNAEHGCDFDQWIKNSVTHIDREQYANLLKEVEQKNDLSQAERNKAINSIHQSLGFTKFFELVGKRNVPIVGHNCYMDLLFLHNSFIGALPQYYSKKLSVEEEEEQKHSQEANDEESKESSTQSNNYKERIFSSFQKLYDSKAISVSFFKEFMTDDNKSTSLESLKEFIYTNLSKYRLAEIQLGQGAYQDYNWDDPNNQQKFHEAGFDSYLTGWIFLQLRQFYVENFKKTEKDFENTFLNNINVMNNRYFLSFGQEEDILQTQILNGNISDDILHIFAHNDPVDPIKEQQQEKMEKFQKQIQDYFESQQYSSRVRASIQNQNFIFIELSLQNNKDQVDIDNLKKKLENDIKEIQKMASELSVKEYEQLIFQQRHNTKKFNNAKPKNNKYQNKK